jgi:hypothetical protein
MNEGRTVICGSKVASIEENKKNLNKKRSGSNFDDDENWDVEIKDLIIDLDADIEKDSSPKAVKSSPSSLRSRHHSMPDSNSSINHSSPTKGTNTVLMPQTPSGKTVTSSTEPSSCLKMKIKRKNGSRSSEVKHEVVLTTEDAKAGHKKHDKNNHHSNGSSSTPTSLPSNGSATTSSNSHKKKNVSKDEDHVS